MGESPAAYRTVRKILPLPSERCLQENFMNFQLRVRQALTDIDDLNLLLEIWQETNGITEAGDPVSGRGRISSDDHDQRKPKSGRP
jgi:hypothetical protein